MTQGPDAGLETRLTADQVEAISRAIGDPRRFAMLRQIAAQPVLSCGGLHLRECLSAATISHHLKELQGAGLIDVAREGRALRLTLRRAVWEAYLRELASF